MTSYVGCLSSPARLRIASRFQTLCPPWSDVDVLRLVSKSNHMDEVTRTSQTGHAVVDDLSDLLKLQSLGLFLVFLVFGVGVVLD